MEFSSLQTLTRGTSLELDRAITWQRSNEGCIDLAALVNSRLKEPLRPIATREVEVFADIDRVLRQRADCRCRRGALARSWSASAGHFG